MKKLKIVAEALRAPLPYWKGLQLYRQKNWAGAEPFFALCTKKSPKHAASFFKLGMTYFKREDWSQAYAYIEKALEIDPSQNGWSKQLKQAGRHLGKSLPSSVKTDEETLRELIEKNSTDARLYDELAKILRKKGKWWQEIEALKSAISLKGKNAHWHYRLGEALEVMKRYKEAAEAYGRSLELKPGNAEWYYRMGYAHEREGHDGPANQQKASVAYQQAIEHDKTHNSARFGIGVFHQKRGHWDQAANAYAAQINHSLLDAELYYRLGMAHDRCYRWREACKAYQAAITLEPSKADWYYRLGFVMERMNAWDKASYYYEEAISLSNKHRPYWFYRLGYVRELSHNYKEACVAFLQTREQRTLDPTPPVENFISDLSSIISQTNSLIYLVALTEEQAENAVAKAAMHAGISNVYIWDLVDGVQDLTDIVSNNINEPLQALQFFEELPKGQNAILILKDFHWYLDDPAVMRKLRKIKRKSIDSKRVLVLLGPNGKLPKEQPDVFNIINFPKDVDAAKLCSETAVNRSKIDIIESAINKDSRHADWYYELGNEYERAQEWEKAAIAYAAAVARKDEHIPSWYYRLGFVLATAGKFKKACDALRESRILKSPYGISDDYYKKNSGFKKAADYTVYYETLKVIEKTIIYESFHGTSMSCNPYAIFLHLIEIEDFKDWRHIWVLNNLENVPDKFKSHKNVIFVKRDSDIYMRYLASSSVLINNSTFPPYFIRKPDQKYLNTWHGTPWKTLGKDIKNNFMEHKNTQRNFLHATHILSPNTHTTNILIDRYDLDGLFNGIVAEFGYPRLDLTLNATTDQKTHLRNRLGISSNKKVVLYAPTWRGSLGSPEIEIEKLTIEIKNLVDLGCHVLFRGHNFVESSICQSKFNHVLVPEDISSNELLAVVDILITDYSSIGFDYLVTNNPIIYYLNDYEKYKEDRGLYFDASDLPGEVCYDFEELKEIVKNKLEGNVSLHSNYRRFKERFCPHENGRVSSRVIDLLFYDKKNNQASVPQHYKKSLLIFGGEFLPNGITTSLINLVNHIDKERFSVSIAIDPNAVSSQLERIEQFDRLPESVKVLPRVGRMNLSIEEKWVLDKFGQHHNLSTKNMYEIYQQAYAREFLRMFGYGNFDIIVEFTGYSRFWSSVFGCCDLDSPVKKSIYQHNDKLGEWSFRFPNLEGVFNLYKYFDSIVSVSRQTMDLNISNLKGLFSLEQNRFMFCDNLQNPEEVILRAEEEIDQDEFKNLFGGDNVVFITMGRISVEKDHAKLIHAFSKVRKYFPHIKLLILGEGPLKNDLSSLIRRLGQHDHIHLLGRRSNPFPFLNRSDCFVLSSNHEGQPMVLFEAMILGKPIISTDIVGSRSALEGRSGHLVENSEEGLINGMVDFLEGRLTFQEYDVSEYQAEALEMFYKKVCGQDLIKNRICA